MINNYFSFDFKLKHETLTTIFTSLQIKWAFRFLHLMDDDICIVTLNFAIITLNKSLKISERCQIWDSWLYPQIANATFYSL
jgi:hypothetical protein